MTIRFEKMIPLPLLEQDTSGSEVWESESVLFEQGKCYILEAPSGRGKTTLLSVIYGIRKDYRGQVYLDNKPVSDFSWKDWALHRKKHFSYIFQGLELFDSLSARDNILLKNSMTGYKTHKEIEEMAQILGMEEFMHRKAGILSFGQQQRVAIARAFITHPDILFADEPTGNLDRDTGEEIMSLFSDLQASGKTLTIVTHDAHIAAYADRVIHLDKGHVV